MPPRCLATTELFRLETHQVPILLRNRGVTLRKGCATRSTCEEPAPDEFRLPMVTERPQRAIGGLRRTPLRSQTTMCIFRAKNPRVENTRLTRNGPPEVSPYGYRL